MQIDSSAKSTGSEFSSTVEYAITVSMPSSRAARSTRRAISPRLAMRIFLNISRYHLVKNALTRASIHKHVHREMIPAEKHNGYKVRI